MLEQEQNKGNLIYFESTSMRELYDSMKKWQDTNHQHFLTLSVQQDNGNFCCIALIHPQKVKQQNTEHEDEMVRFRRKALKHIGVAVNFESSTISHPKILAIQSKLKKCTTSEEVMKVFAEEM